MNRQPYNRWDEEIQRLASEFSYPPTPDLTAAIPSRTNPLLHRNLRPVWALLLTLIVLLVGLLSVPPLRAAIIDWWQIGAVRIWRVPPPATPIPTPIQAKSIMLPTVQPTAQPTATPLLSVLDFAGETTLVDAQSRVDFPIDLPTLPAGLGEPHHIYLQQAEGDMVILVWMWPEQLEQVRMSFHILGPGAFVWKMQPPSIAEVMVNGAPAIWTKGPYYIQAGGSWGSRRLVDGHVLIWTAGDLTYRLESDLDMDKALQVAESVHAPTTLPKE